MDINLESVIQDCIDISKIPLVTGFEGDSSEDLETKLRDLKLPGYDIEKTKSNLIILKPKTPSSSIIIAHYDREGLIVDENGFIVHAVEYYKRRNGLKQNLSQKLCDSRGQRMIGLHTPYGKVIGFQIVDDDISGNSVRYHLEGELPEKGTVISLGGLRRKENSLVGLCDNVVSIGVLYSLLKQSSFDNLDNTSQIILTPREVGLSAQLLLEYFNKERIPSNRDIYVLDTTPVENLEKGVLMLRNRDSRHTFDEDATNRVNETCSHLGIPIKFKDKILEEQGKIIFKKDGSVRGYGLTELGKLAQLSEGRYNGTTLQIPNDGDGYQQSVSLTSLDNYASAIMGLSRSHL